MSEPASHQLVVDALRWQVEQYAELLSQVDLDETIVVLASDCSGYASHSRTDLPVVIIGNAAGRLRQGELIEVEADQADFAAPSPRPSASG